MAELVVILPAEVGLSSLIREVTADELDEWLGATRRTRVSVELPRFRLTGCHSLVPVVRQSGVSSFATRKQDFSRMDPTGKLLQSTELIQHCRLTTDESGTEGVAVTTTTARTATRHGTPPPIATFHVDRPFITLVRHIASGVILFSACVTDPSKE